MFDELPSDVVSVLTQLLDEGQTAVVEGEYGTARQTIQTVEAVSRNKLPKSDLRGQLRHGCERVNAALDPSGGVDNDIAAEYLRAMGQTLAETR